MGQGPSALTMPIHWDKHPTEAPVTPGAFSHKTGAAPAIHAVLSPHRSLPPEGFAWVISLTFLFILIPVIPLLGTPVMWGLLPFVMGAVWLLWSFLRRNYRDGFLTEELSLWPDRIEIVRTDPKGTVKEWIADPYWVKLELHRKGGPVTDYVTLSGAGRTVELGAFLSPEERRGLYGDLEPVLQRLKR